MAAATTKSHFHHPDAAPQPKKTSARPRPITEAERAAIEPFLEKVHYSPRSAPASIVPFLFWELMTDTLMIIMNTGLGCVGVGVNG
jgi:hypothetical protein